MGATSCDMAFHGDEGDSSDGVFDHSKPMPQLTPASFGQLGINNIDIQAIDPRVFGGVVAPAGQQDEFLFSGVSNRHWGEKLTYSLGVSYLAGGLLGASYGLVEGIRQGAGLPTKLRINRILNFAGFRGGKLANGLGAMTLLYCGVESFITNVRGDEDQL